MEHKKQLFVIYNMKLAGYLMTQGCKLVAIEPDRKNPEYFIYLFPRTPQLEGIVANYQASRHKN